MFNRTEYMRNYRRTHREQLREQRFRICRKYRLKHLKLYVKATKKWQKNHPEKTRENWAKHEAKRRQLGFIPLNEPFPNSESHHINNEFVFYIPKELHHSVRHSVLRNQNMVEINAKTLFWVGV